MGEFSIPCLVTELQAEYRPKSLRKYIECTDHNIQPAHEHLNANEWMAYLYHDGDEIQAERCATFKLVHRYRVYGGDVFRGTKP